MMIYTVEYQDRIIGYYKTWELAERALPKFMKSRAYSPLIEEFNISWVRVVEC